MKKFTFAAAAVAILASPIALAQQAQQTQHVQGGPTVQNGQCFKSSTGKDEAFGTWQACAKPAAAAATPTTQQRRRARSASR
jgi:hypothetical protein